MGEIVINQETEQVPPKRKRGRQKGDLQTYYTPRQKANAILAAETMGIAEASRRLKIPLNTIINWQKRKKGVQRDTEGIYDRNRKKLAFKAQKVVEENLKQLLNPDKIADATYVDHVRAAEVATNVAEKLMDKPTSRIVQEGLTSEQCIAGLVELARIAAQRRMAALSDGGGEAEIPQVHVKVIEHKPIK
jgi:transposase